MLKKIFITVISTFTFLFAYTNITPAREIVPVPHWQKKEISVYIPKSENKSTVSAIKSAFSCWQRASAGHINFKYIKEPSADISIVFTEKASGSASPYTMTSVSSENNSISKAEISIATENAEFKNLSNKYISNVLLNEVGKALGLPNNPRKPSSIMHDPVTEQQKFMKIDAVKLFSISEWQYSKKNIKKEKSE